MKLSSKLQEAVDKAFAAIDVDGSKEIEISEGIKFFKNFGKINAKVLFEEMDENADGKINYDEWNFYFKRVMMTGLYKEEDVIEEIEQIMVGEAFMHFSVPKMVQQPVAEPERKVSLSGLSRLSGRIHPQPRVSEQPPVDMKIFT